MSDCGKCLTDVNVFFFSKLVINIKIFDFCFCRPLPVSSTTTRSKRLSTCLRPLTKKMLHLAPTNLRSVFLSNMLAHVADITPDNAMRLINNFIVHHRPKKGLA